MRRRYWGPELPLPLSTLPYPCLAPSRSHLWKKGKTESGQEITRCLGQPHLDFAVKSFGTIIASTM